MSLTQAGRTVLPAFLFNGGSSCPTRQPVLLLCGVGGGENVIAMGLHGLKTDRSCCTMGQRSHCSGALPGPCACQLRPGQLSQLRHLQVVLPAAHQLPSSAGGGAAGSRLLPQRGLLGQEQVVMRIPRDLGCPSGSGIQTAECSPTQVEDLGP